MGFQSGAGSHSLLFVSPFVFLHNFSIPPALPVCSFLLECIESAQWCEASDLRRLVWIYQFESSSSWLSGSHSYFPIIGPQGEDSYSNSSFLAAYYLHTCWWFLPYLAQPSSLLRYLILQYPSFNSSPRNLFLVTSQEVIDLGQVLVSIICCAPFTVSTRPWRMYTIQCTVFATVIETVLGSLYFGEKQKLRNCKPIFSPKH